MYLLILFITLISDLLSTNLKKNKNSIEKVDKGKGGWVGRQIEKTAPVVIATAIIA